MDCGHWLATQGRYCAAPGARQYIQGWRCPEHTPARLAGLPEPGTGAYCAPKRCYCGECPAYTETTHYPPSEVETWPIEARHVASGKRRASPNVQAAAKTEVAAQRAREARHRRTTRPNTGPATLT